MDIDDKTIQVLQRVVTKVSAIIDPLCNSRPEINERSQTEWHEKILRIRSDIESDQMLLFIGPFSSGKSTFINALLGEGLLPTAARPCTSVVTELSFTKDGGHRGNIIFHDGKIEKMFWEELIKIIDGPRGAIGQVAQIHHIELVYDIMELVDWETHPLAAMESMKVKIVDCPGYGSPYITNEDVIDEYIQKASYTFWMSPADKFGGALAERKLSDIKKRTTTLIPVITMADKINQAQREQVSDDFYEHLGHLFKQKEPRFVSALKYNDIRELEKKLTPKNPKDELPKEEKEKIKQKMEKLKAEAGLEQIFADMIGSAKKRKVTESKVTSALFDLAGLLKDLQYRAEKEESFWQKEAEKSGWTPNDEYKKLNEIRDKVDAWIKAESERVADVIETAMIKALADYRMETKGKVEDGPVMGIIGGVWEEELNKRKDKWAEHLEKEYREFAEGSATFMAGNAFKPPALNSIMAGLNNSIMAVLESLRYAGAQSLLTMGLGGALIAAAPAVKGLVLVGTALSGIMGIVGIAAIGLGIFPLIPVIQDKIRHRKEEYRKETEKTLQDWMKKLDLVPVIQNMLNKENEKMYDSYMTNFGVTITPILRKHERCKEIKEDISGMRTEINDIFPNETKRQI